MSLTVRTVSKHLTDYERIQQLYHTAFPVEEQVKWSWLMHKARSKYVDFLIYYDDNQFVGFSYLIHRNNLNFLFFLAVDPDLHSQGYGGQILEWLQAKHSEEPIVLDMEPLDEQAANAKQRQRRFAFYQQHGFSDTNYQVVENGVRYTILANQKHFKIQQLESTYRWFSWPFYHRQHIQIIP